MCANDLRMQCVFHHRVYIETVMPMYGISQVRTTINSHGAGLSFHLQPTVTNNCTHITLRWEVALQVLYALLPYTADHFIRKPPTESSWPHHKP